MPEEKTKIRLGKVSLMPKGTWNSASTYERLDVVYVNGSSYVAVQDVPANTEILNTTYWSSLASRGETGASGVGADNIVNMIGEEFDDTQAYAVGNYCIYDDVLYRFTSAHTGAWDSSHVVSITAAEELQGKQNTLTFDSKPTASSTNPVTSGGIKTALDGKANNSIIADSFSESVSYAVGNYCVYEGALYRFTSAHSAGVWNSSDVVQVVVADELESLSALVESRMDYKVTGTVSASNYTLTDARINNDHWEVDWIRFDDSAKVTTQIHWVTDIANHTVSLGATYTGSTAVVVNMHWVQ